KVFDINGKEISKLVSEIINAGSYSVEFNSFGLPSGTYYYRMESNLISETKKMILIK
ncbi:MAG: T9SS type A sorting domain-containing protein, partial [Ignavibacteria bacterium]|nr:T9SS type A sorting domain-containing protein [Ignavibacteria bacterium]